MAEGINLALLPPLDVVKQVDHEAIIADVVERAGLENASPSDPAFRVTLANTYREVLLRQDANEQALGLTLAYATGPELDHIGSTYYQHPDGSPVLRLTGEDDDDYRVRLQKSPEGLSVAGPDGAYEYHARSAHPDVKGVAVDSPEPVEVVLSILSHSGTGEPSQSVLDAVMTYIEPFRPMTDKVSVVGATVQSYQVTASLFIKHGPDPELVRQNAEVRLLAYVADQHKLNGRVVESGVHAALTLEGVEEVRLTGWNDIICNKQQAPFCSNVSVTIGDLV
ncbi:baseplate assembly protein [Photobacterium damselae]|uniref:baseplate assembly protein n=1 Tax=Photobacterium damselae TaxID=38293 RepID=UPI001EFC81E7|nr:baseplate J/gp47 family protein [Photobacterium damselae]MCG9780426.1 baseplate J/gp47 family protein [Photobacterium damselae]